MRVPTHVGLRAEGKSMARVGLELKGRWGLQALVGTGLGIGLILVTALLIRSAGGFHWGFP